MTHEFYGDEPYFRRTWGAEGYRHTFEQVAPVMPVVLEEHLLNLHDEGRLQMHLPEGEWDGTDVEWPMPVGTVVRLTFDNGKWFFYVESYDFERNSYELRMPD